MSVTAFRVHTPDRRDLRTRRDTASKLQEIALRSPQDMAAFDHLADTVLRRLNEEDRQKPPA